MARRSRPDRPLRTIALVLGLVGTALLVGPPGGVDGFASIKLAVLGVAAVVLVVGSGLEVASRARLQPTSAPSVVAAASFGVVGLSVATASPSAALAWAGALARWNGVGLYLICVMLFVAAIRLSPAQIDVLVRALVITAGLIGLQGINEATLDVGHLPAGEFGIASTLGNPNFVSAYGGSALAAAVYGALNRRWGRPWRLTAVASGLLAVSAVVVSRSAQGVLVAAAAMVVLGLVHASTRWSRRRLQVATGGVGLAALLVGVAIGLGATGAGPLRALGDDTGVQHRLYYWQAAVSMVADEPVTGVGPGHFSYHYRAHRPLEDALDSPLTDNTDSAHNVPLQMFAEGGVLWGLTYLAWVVAVFVALVRALRSTRDEARLLVGIVGAVWVGYVLQSLISIDVPPLAVLGWTFAGAVVALAPPSGRTQTIRLPWRPAGRRGTPSMGQRVFELVSIVTALAVLWLGTTPYRADFAATDPSALSDDLDADRATRIASWEPEYPLRLVPALLERERLADARALAETAAERSPLDLEAVLMSARLQATANDVDAARVSYAQALTIEPMHPELILEVAAFARDSGDMAWARELAEGVLAAVPDHEEATALLEGLD